MMKHLLLLLLFLACHPREVEGPPVQQGPYFSPAQVITALNLMSAIIDYPAETSAEQKNFNVNAEQAKKLILPLHPLYDEKVNETYGAMANWDKEKLSSTTAACVQTCTCDFYQEVFSRFPDLLEKNPDMRGFAGSKFTKTLDQVQKCLQNAASIQPLLEHLHKEKSRYEADSVF